MLLARNSPLVYSSPPPFAHRLRLARISSPILASRKSRFPAIGTSVSIVLEQGDEKRTWRREKSRRAKIYLRIILKKSFTKHRLILHRSCRRRRRHWQTPSWVITPQSSTPLADAPCTTLHEPAPAGFGEGSEVEVVVAEEAEQGLVDLDEAGVCCGMARVVERGARLWIG